MISVKVTIAMMRDHYQQQVEEERVCFVTLSLLVPQLEEVRVRNLNKAGTWRQELMQGPWRSAAYWLAPHGLLSLLFVCLFIIRSFIHSLTHFTSGSKAPPQSNPFLYLPRGGPTQNGLSPPLSITS